MGERTLRPQNLRLVLRAESGLNVGQVYPLAQPRNFLGRRVDAVIAVDDSKASRNHAAIDLQNGFYHLADLGSTNGTYYNERRLEGSVIIKVGDRIRIGSTVFSVDLWDRARHQIPQAWNEATRVILPSDLAKTKLPERALEESDPGTPRWHFLQKSTAKIGPDRARWMLAGLCGLLILAAIATTWLGVS